jgi:hypothetical protein
LSISYDASDLYAVQVKIVTVYCLIMILQSFDAEAMTVVIFEYLLNLISY